MEIKQIFETQLLELLNEIKTKLPLSDINYIIEFIEKNEWGLAYETLCSQIYEYEIPISCELYEKIASLGRLMKLHSNTWVPLKELIAKV